MPNDLAELFADPATVRGWTQEDLFSIRLDDVADAQLAALQTRYAQMRPRIRLVERLADDIKIDRIERLEDITPLCLPHTTYKSYSAAHVEGGRFDRMTRWLSGLTAHDLSGLDLAGVDSLESWLGRLDEHTPLRLLTSSGTSGKMFVLPKKPS